jgi:hypothetical protein
MNHLVYNLYRYQHAYINVFAIIQIVSDIEKSLYLHIIMTVTALIIDKTGEIKEQKFKSINEGDLYKKAGLKKPDGFVKQTEWEVNLQGKSYNILLYGKTTGRANHENKYEFPPPVDNVLYFGSCILINTNENNEYENLTKKEWKLAYDNLYGGFDEVDEEEDDEEDDEDEDLPRTKSGYVKDDFIVDDDEEDEEDEFDDEEEDEFDDEEDEDEIIKPIKKKRKSARLEKKTSLKKKKQVQLVNNFVDVDMDQKYMEYSGELSEEEYI